MANLTSGVINVTTAGTAVAGPGTTSPGWYAFTAHGGNSGTYVYIGNDGADDVASTTGFKLDVDDILYLHVSEDLAHLYFDVDTSGDDVCYIKVAGPAFGAAI